MSKDSAFSIIEQDNSDSKTIDGLFMLFCQKLQESGEVECKSKEFAGLKSNLDRVQFILKILDKSAVEISFSKNLQKKNWLADKFRKDGNVFFLKKQDMKAAACYNGCLCFAEEGSENIALAYANRSAVWFQRGLYQECLEDIKLALQNNYPKDLRNKLLIRASKAEALADTQTKIPHYDPPPQVKVGPHPLMPSASKALKIVNSENFGRHVITSLDLEVGDVLVVEEAFATVPLTLEHTFHCSHCLDFSYNLIPCKSCPMAMFCSEKCIKEAERYHKYECPILGILHKMKMPKLSRLALRIALLARDAYKNGLEYKGEDVDVYRSDRYLEVHNLVQNTSRRKVNDLCVKAHSAALLFVLIEQKTNFFKDLEENLPNIEDLSMGDDIQNTEKITDIRQKQDLGQGDCKSNASQDDLNVSKDCNSPKEESNPYLGKEDSISNLAKENDSPHSSKGDRSPNLLTEDSNANLGKEDSNPNLSKENSNPNLAKEDCQSNSSDKARSIQDLFMDTLLLHSQTGPCNFHEISELVEDEEGYYNPDEKGSGAFPFLSLLNHSCSPNVTRNCHGTKLVLRALRPIKAGEQLFDNYGYHFAVTPKENRQASLSNQYFFDCCCEPCEKNWPLLKGIPDKNLGLDVDDDIFILLRKGSLEEAQKAYKELEKLANKFDYQFACTDLCKLQETLKQCYAIFGNRSYV